MLSLCNKKGSVTRRSSPRNFNRRRQTDETDGGFNSDSIDTEVIVNDQLVDDSTDDSLGVRNLGGMISQSGVACTNVTTVGMSSIYCLRSCIVFPNRISLRTGHSF